MCGIVGFVHQGRAPEELEPAVKALRHRGPDAEGSRYFDAADVFLGHTRLSVIDLSPAASQPMASDDEQVWIVYNGEIYNFPELRKELEEKGVRFRSRSDTEVLLRLYEAKGESFLRQLNGIFALGILDLRRDEILLARDHLGVKPLYYTQDNQALAFASEIKALMAVGAATKEIDWQAVYDYFSYLYVPCPATAFASVRQLRPGHFAVYDLKQRHFREQRYWDPLSGVGSALAMAANDRVAFLEEVRATLEDSVKRQLISDVPLGVFLSGGIDSATLAALTTRVQARPPKTFTVVFEGDGIAPYDERETAEAVSRHLGTEHTEVSVRVNDPEEVFEIGSGFDQPFGNPTFYLSYLVAKATREFVTVVLSGAGGDELFAGYPRYRAAAFGASLSRLPAFVGELAGRGLEHVPDRAEQPLIRHAKLLLRGVGVPKAEQYLRWTYFSSDTEKQALLAPLLLRSRNEPSTRILELHWPVSSGLDALGQTQAVDLHTFLVDNILEYTDKTTMAVGLEARVPMLDPRLVPLCLAMPRSCKISERKTKVWLRDAYPDLLPPGVLKAPKRGFCAPLPAWIKNHFDALFERELTRSYVRDQNIFDYDTIQTLRAEQRSGARDNSMQLFGILMFDRWLRRWF